MESGLGSGEVAPPLRRYYLKVLVLGDAGVGKTVRLHRSYDTAVKVVF
jgi:hypothetical protein